MITINDNKRHEHKPSGIGNLKKSSKRQRFINKAEKAIESQAANAVLYANSIKYGIIEHKIETYKAKNKARRAEFAAKRKAKL